MLPGLSALEIGRLRMSVGYSGHKKGRPLSPAEVGALLHRACEAGASRDECAKFLGLRGPDVVASFLQVSKAVPADLLHLVSWGQSTDSISFTTTIELARIRSAEDRRAVAASIIEHRLRRHEVRAVAQIRKRSRKTIQECIREVLGMRPVVERIYVFMGAIIDHEVNTALASRTQAERNSLLGSGLAALGIEGSGRLGEQLFTIVGDERLNSQLNRDGREVVESRLRMYIKENVG